MKAMLGAAMAVLFAGTVVASANEVNWLGANIKALDDYAEAWWVEWQEETQVYDEDLGDFVTVPAQWVWREGFDASVMDPFTQAGSASVDVSAYDPAVNYSLWSNGEVPGPGDTARFVWHSDRRARPGSASGIIYVGGAGVIEQEVIISGEAFNPDHIYHSSRGWQQLLSNVLVQKDLTVETVYWHSGNTTGMRGHLWVSNNHSLTVTGAVDMFVLDYHGGNAFRLDGANAALRFDAAAQTLNPMPTGYVHGSQGPYGSRALGGNGRVEFVHEAATITLGSPGQRVTRDTGAGTQGHPTIAFPVLNIGSNVLHVRSDQTWENNPDGTGLIVLRPRNEEPIVESLDLQPLHNLGNVPFSVYTQRNQAFHVAEGTYQSFWMWGALHYATNWSEMRLTGDVTLTGGTVLPGAAPDPDDPDDLGTDAMQSEYSVVLRGSGTYGQYLGVNGHTLTTARGIHVYGGGNTTDRDRSRILAAGSTLDIGGDLFLESGSFAAGNQADGVLVETRNVGVFGDANTVLTLRGNFRTNVRSVAGNGLHLSTVNLVGGSANPERNTWEVGSDPADEFGPNTYAIGVMNIGTPTEPGHIRLVNEFINDGDPDNVAKDGSGEILLAGTLNIHDGSSLDLDGQGVRVETALWISDTGTLDLNTGLTLAEDDIVYSFMGVGDQTAAWDLFAGRVIDSSNPDFTFVATTNQPNTYWQAIPEPGSVALLALGGLALLASRRRRS